MLGRRRPPTPADRSCEPSVPIADVIGGLGERCCAVCFVAGSCAGRGAAGLDVTAGARGDDEAAEVGGGIGAWPGWGGGGLRRCCAGAAVVRVGLEPVAVPATGSVSVSVSLPVGSGEVWRVSVGDCLSLDELAAASSAALAAWTSRANQLMLYQRPAQSTERITKWIEEVVMRSMKRRTWSVPKVALVAIRRVGVGPGVKTDSQRLVMNVAILFK